MSNKKYMFQTSPKYIIVFLVSIFYAVCSHAQTKKIDSLRDLFAGASSVAKQREVVLGICDQYYSLSSDSLLKYINLGKKYFPPGSAEYFRVQNFYCIYLYKTGQIGAGMRLSDSLIQSFTSNNPSANANRMEIMGTQVNGLIRNGENKAAIELSFDILKEAEKARDTEFVMRSYILLGWANMEIEKYHEAIKWLSKGIRSTSEPSIMENNPYLFSNIASSYNNIGRPDSALYFINLALRYGYASENLTNIANSLNIRADIFIHQHNYEAAEKDMQAALEVRKKIGDMLYVTSDMAQLSSFYASVNETSKGIDIAKEGIELAKKANNLNKLIFLYTALSENYLRSNQLSPYCNTLETIISLKDSLYKKNSGDAIAEMEVKYNLQKQQNIIITQDYALTQSRYLSIGSSALFLLGLLLGWVLYRNYRLSQQKKLASALVHQKLLSYKAVELARENERKRIAADLHDNLGSYAAAITANVKYLQEKRSTENDIFMSQLDANAQSMVTQLSDTIWVLKNEHLPITGLADRFKLWMMRLMKNYPNLRYYYSENIEKDIEFTPATILNIFLMLKECVNNALKHSDCTALKIVFFSSDYWQITIEDNGKGFDNSFFSRGSGVDNIRNRAKESGWNVEWQKVIPSGTRVIISGKT